MRAVVQRVARASVSVDGRTVGRIDAGLLVLLGVGRKDGPSEADFLARKISNLRIFEDSGGNMNRSVKDIEGGMLVVSQFTLYGDCRKGRRPSFVDAAPPESATALYERFVDRVDQEGVAVQTGRFGALMRVSLVNDGPVTLIVESPGG
jgi:D-tyrosyl-tRNA(Tyr) deacylase